MWKNKYRSFERLQTLQLLRYPFINCLKAFPVILGSPFDPSCSFWGSRGRLDLKKTKTKTKKHIIMDHPGNSEGKESACNVGDMCSVSRSGRSPGEGNGYPLQHSCLENSMDRGAWWATVYGVTEGQTRLSNLILLSLWDFPAGSDCEKSACNEWDSGLISGLGRSGEGNSYPLQQFLRTQRKTIPKKTKKSI